METRNPYEVELGKATLALATLLVREMDTLGKHRLDHRACDSPLERRGADAARRIVWLCRNLDAEVRRYEYLRALADLGDELPEDNIPF